MTDIPPPKEVYADSNGNLSSTPPDELPPGQIILPGAQPPTQ